MLQVEDLSLEVAGHTVVEAATFSLRPGDKVGLVGRNGAGKTSLLKVLVGEESPVAGRILRTGQTGYLSQDPRGDGSDPGTPGLSRIISGRGLDEDAVRLEKLRVQLEENPSTRNIARFSRAEELYRATGGYSAESAARRIAAGLGVDQSRLDLPVAALSGGERRRVELARILFSGSDLLLLDEPTNHLDTDAKTWLMKFLRSYKGALLVVSHDLWLLDNAITRVLHLDEDDLVEYRGTYSEYRTARLLDEKRRARLVARQQSEIGRLKKLADTMRGQTVRRARTAKSIDTRLERLRATAEVGAQRTRSLHVRFPDPPRSGEIVAKATGLTKGYGDTPVFEGIDFEVGRGERLFVMGLNGAGKTSLLKIIAGVSEADAGAVSFGAHVSPGYYAQEHEGITAGVTVLDHMREHGTASDQQLRALLGMFGLTGEMAFQDAGTLSGGEKTKLALAQLVAGRHNLLLLDEPTNNLDPPSLLSIAAALASWPGAMIIVSHDRAFVEELAPDRVLFMPDGDIDYWGNELLDLVSMS
jgi:ATPase subunit of ABC transporter with duplicated ATPase domains